MGQAVVSHAPDCIYKLLFMTVHKKNSFKFMQKIKKMTVFITANFIKLVGCY